MAITEIRKIADAIQGKKLIGLGKNLSSIYPAKDLYFSTSPVVHHRIKSGDRTIILVHKKYAEDAEIITGDIAIGYEGKI